MTFFLDINYFGLKDFFNDTDIQLKYLQHVDTIKDLLYPHEQDDVIVNHDDLVQTIYQVSGKKISLESLHEFLSHFKSQVIGGDPQIYTFGQVKSVLEKGQFFLEQLYFNSVTYKHYESILEQNAPLPDLPFPNLESYRVIRGSSLVGHWKTFEKLASSTRFYKNPESGVVIFDHQIQRSLFGLQMISFLVNGLNWFFPAYSTQRDDGVFEMTKGNFRKVVDEYKMFLQEINVLPLHVEKTINEVFLAGDLFHVHSDGNLKLSVHELAETAIIIMNSKKGLDSLIHDLLQICPDQGGREPAFDTECFRDNFHHIFLRATLF